MVEVTEAAADVLVRAHEAATRFNPDARVRVFMGRTEIETALTDVREPTDAVLDINGIEVFVGEGVEGTLDVTPPHDRLIVR